MGSPRAKSFDCVTNIPKSPPLPMLKGRDTTAVRRATIANTVNLDTSIAPRNGHEMADRFRMARFLKRRAGSASFPTKVPILPASFTAMTLKKPKRYPMMMTAKDWAIAGKRLLTEGPDMMYESSLPDVIQPK